MSTLVEVAWIMLVHSWPFTLAFGVALAWPRRTSDA